jgi:hypothetical protein
MSRRPELPTRKRIREHWRNWFWERHEDDPDNGCCFACGFISGRTLERAHIVARCNGGSDDVSNLHLLCHTCHRASEYIEGDNYFVWLDEWSVADRSILELAKIGVPIWTRFIQHLPLTHELAAELSGWMHPEYIFKSTKGENNAHAEAADG